MLDLTGSEQGQVVGFAIWGSVFRYQNIRFLEHNFANHLIATTCILLIKYTPRHEDVWGE
jgi:hypothetical protein